MATTTTQAGFSTVRKCIMLFGAVSAVVLATVAVMASTGHEATSFMWFRGVILLGVTPLLLRLAARAAEGSYRDFDRLRTVSTIMPVALVAVDLVPGLCPPWYAVLQGLSALALAAVAVLTRTSAFPKQP